ncbi:MAG: hypothetical protein ABIP20_07395 [Chthoniobacteraceae bacterium]
MDTGPGAANGCWDPANDDRRFTPIRCSMMLVAAPMVPADAAMSGGKRADSGVTPVLSPDLRSAAFDANAKANHRGEWGVGCRTIPPDERAMFDDNVTKTLNNITPSSEGVVLSSAFASPFSGKIVLSNE